MIAHFENNLFVQVAYKKLQVQVEAVKVFSEESYLRPEEKVSERRDSEANDDEENTEAVQIVRC